MSKRSKRTYTEKEEFKKGEFKIFDFNRSERGEKKC